MKQSTTIDTAKLQLQLDQVEVFMISEMNCGANLRKIEKWEKDFAAWKSKNGFHLADDCDSVMDTIRMRMEGENV